MRAARRIPFLAERLVVVIVVVTFGSIGASGTGVAMNSTHHKANSKVGKIVFAADNQGAVFVNGIRKDSVSHWMQVGRVTVYLSKGDVVSIKAVDFGVWYGVVADLEYDGEHYGTGSNDWKAMKKFDLVGVHNKDAWMLPEYSSCKWPAAEIRPREDEYFAGKAKDFPTSLKAKYVWAEDAGENDKIFMRLVVGGEACGQAKTLPPPTREINGENVQVTGGATLETGTTLGGQSDDSGTAACPCKISTATSPGICWEMIENGDGRCFWRDCEDRYECVLSDEEAPFMCIRRWASEKVVHVSGAGQEDYCNKTSTTPTEFYSPYNE